MLRQRNNLEGWTPSLLPFSPRSGSCHSAHRPLARANHMTPTQFQEGGKYGEQTERLVTIPISATVSTVFFFFFTILKKLE